MTDQDHDAALAGAMHRLQKVITDAVADGLQVRFKVEENAPHHLIYQMARVYAGSVNAIKPAEQSA